MTSESKILTVSYGTFSCTLEGFDNPFDTMKAIAEYFRDLAAQDRHFGAEPPTPDAAMLHRLAEREVSRLAASRREDSARLQTGDAPGAPAPRIQMNPVPRRPDQVPPAAEPPQEEAAPGIEPSLLDVIPDGVAAKLARIRKAVNPSVPLAESPFFADPTRTEPAFPEEASAEDAALTDTEADLVEPAAMTQADIEATSGTPADHVADVAARLGALISSERMTDAEWGQADKDGAELSEDLQLAGAWTDGIPDEVETGAEADAPEAPMAELVAQDGDAETVAELEVDANAPLPVEIAEEAEAAIHLIGDDLDEIAGFGPGEYPPEDSMTAEDVALLAQLDATVFDEDSLVAALDDTLPEDQPVAFSLAEAEMQDPLPESIADETFAEELEERPDGAAALSEAEGQDEVAEEAVDAGVDALAEAEDQDVFVAEAAKPVSETTEVEVAAEAAETVTEAPEPEITASGKSGSRTRRVNSRVVRIHPSEDPSTRDPSATRPVDAGEEADEVARLMQQAEEVMAEDENRRRHEALSRLKAAVAATEADRADIDYEAPKADASLDPYRGDLAEAIQPDSAKEPAAAPEVKPRRKSVTIRPQEPRPGTIRPGMISPPPLVLVSEQRIDRVGPAEPSTQTPAAAEAPAMAPPAPAYIPASAPASLPGEGQPMVALRTGRLSGAIGAGAAMAASSLPAHNLVLEKPSYGPAAEADDEDELLDDAKDINEAGLASFAEMVGARSMAEMLEAAAAYATCVEKRNQFTRPQLMRRMMASAAGKPVSREDGLRSFGTLLRTGRIEKVNRGHYSLAETSPYLAEARRLN